MFFCQTLQHHSENSALCQEYTQTFAKPLSLIPNKNRFYWKAEFNRKESNMNGKDCKYHLLSLMGTCVTDFYIDLIICCALKNCIQDAQPRWHTCAFTNVFANALLISGHMACTCKPPMQAVTAPPTTRETQGRRKQVRTWLVTLLVLLKHNLTQNNP
jgi:hypothetical protein